MGHKTLHSKNTQVEYRYFENEADMLRDWIKWLNEFKPDVITGWNTRFFDIPYLVNRVERILGEEEVRRISLEDCQRW